MEMQSFSLLRKEIMKSPTRYIFVAVTAAMLLSSTVFAQDEPKSYSGDLWTRPALTGDWGGVRNNLAAKGVTFDISANQIEQGVDDGGRKSGGADSGRAVFNLNVDSQKLGLWPGGFLMVEAESSWGEAANMNTGALMPANSSQIYPWPGVEQFAIPQVALIQFLSGYVGVVLGKFDTTSGDMNDFAHGKGDTQFLNLALNLNPVTVVSTPYSTLGAGLIILPVKENPDAALITLSALASDGKPSTSGFDTVANGNNVYAAEGRVRTDFFDLTGHQLVGGTYSTKTFSSIDQNLRFIIENREIEKKDGTWSAYYNFDQYLYETKKGSGKGLGIFGRFGLSDGNPNPMHYFYSIGLGGKDVIPNRALDSFGIGYYYITINHPSFTGPLQTRNILQDEQGFEAYYNVAITPWMRLTPDIQFIKGAQKFAVSSSNGLPALEDINTATVAGIRLQVIF